MLKTGRESIVVLVNVFFFGFFVAKQLVVSGVVAVKTHGSVSIHSNGNVAFDLVAIYFQQKENEEKKPKINHM